MSEWLGDWPIGALERGANAFGVLACAVAVGLLAAAHGAESLGAVALYVALQSGAVHTARALHYEAWPTLRYGVAGLGLGVCGLLHAVTRGVFPDAYLEHIGGAPAEDALGVAAAVFAYGVVPFLCVLHVWDARRAPPRFWAPVLLAVTELSAVTVVHEIAVDRERASNNNDLVFVYLASVAAAGGTALLAEGVNRARYEAFAPPKVFETPIEAAVELPRVRTVPQLRRCTAV